MNESKQKDRRQYRRFPFNGEVKISGKIPVEPSDISEAGIHVLTRRSLMLGTDFEVSLSIQDKELTVRAVVQNKQEGVGMGLVFVAEDPATKEKIRNFMEDIKADLARRSYKKERVLLIDDDVLFRKVCRCKFMSEGFSVTESSGGVEVTELIDTSPADVIVLNLGLKHFDGLNMLCMLKKSLTYKKIPLVAFSTAESEETEEKAKSACADIYLTATIFSSSDLVRKVKELLPL